MAWACHLGYTKRLRKISHTKSINLLMLLFIILYISVNLVSSLEFNCEPIENSCLCHEGFDDDDWEILCPNSHREVYDITIKLKPLINGDAYLTIVCDHEKPEVEWNLVQGINFKMDEAKYNVTEVLVQYCPTSSIENPNVLKDFFIKMNLSLNKIKRFVFLPSTYYSSSSFPVDMFTDMPNLEIMDLQKLNLTTIPDLSNLTYLKELKLRDNKISVIHSETFMSTQRLQHLDLSLNEIKYLPQNTLPESLEHLNLSKNNISNISRETFSKLKSLQQLVLTKNPLHNLNEDAFAELKGLVHLQLDSAKFHKFPKFHNLPNLVEVSISYRNHEMEELKNHSSRLQSAALKKFQDGVGEFQGHVSDMPGLTKIIFSNDGLVAFPMLQNLPNLTFLQLNGNKIQVVPPGALDEFKMLKTLNLSNNQIRNLGDLGTSNLVNLDLGNNELETVDSTLFAKLTNLEYLQLSHNKIRKIDPKAFKFLKLLTTMDLSHNFISFEEPKTPDEYMSGDDGFFSIGFDHQSPLRFCTKLQKLVLNHNEIEMIFNDWTFLFGGLKILDLSYNRISFLHATSLSFSASDLTLDLSRNNISTISMDNAEFIIEDAEKRILRIIVDENPLNCDCNLHAFKLFRLKGVYFKYTNLTCAEPSWLHGIQFRDVPATDLLCPVHHQLGCPATCDCWNIPANKTISVDCSYRKIGNSYIPDVYAINQKWAERYIFTLNLAGNNITDLGNNETNNITSRIVKVDLSENKLTSLAFLNLLANTNNVTSFYLAKNMFSCNDCDFHKLLRMHFKRVSDYTNVSCLYVTDDGTGEKRTVHYNVEEFPEEQVCRQIVLASEVQAMIVISSIFLILLVVFIAVYFRYGWAIRAYLYSKGFGCCFGFDENEDDKEKIYDAFVSYSHKDEDWVLSQLVTRLEEQEGFKLCLHFRDWTPGDWIPDQIVRSVDKSRRTVVILSKHFVESVWSRLEFKAAHSQALNEKANRLILVMMDDDLKDQDVKDNDLKVYMKMNTYLKYGDPWFWHKLKYALPHKKSISAEGHFLKQQQRERAIQLDKLRAKMENTIA